MAEPDICTSREAVHPNIIIRDVVKLSIGVFLCIIYARLVYVLLTRPRFKSNIFYKLIVLNGISACICYISFIVITRYPIVLYILKKDVRLADQWSTWMSFPMFLSYYTPLSGFIGIFFSALNRMTAIMGIETIVTF
jgi:hypothetical protein